MISSNCRTLISRWPSPKMSGTIFVGVIIKMTSQWLRWRLKSQASRLLIQPFVQAPIKEKSQSSASLVFVRGIHRWTVNSSTNINNASVGWCHHDPTHNSKLSGYLCLCAFGKWIVFSCLSCCSITVDANARAMWSLNYSFRCLWISD